MEPTFRSTGAGVRVSLAGEHAALLRRVPDDVLRVLDEPAEGVDELGRERGATDPGRERLFPRAYLDPTEEQAEDDWQRMVHPELVAAKRAAARTMAESLARLERRGDRLAVDLDAGETEAWLSVLNDARLVLGTRLGVEDGPDYDRVDPDDPDAALFLFYGFLTLLTGELVEVLLGPSTEV